MDFLTSIGVLLSCGLLLGSLCKRLHLPSLIGMLIVGIVLSPYALNLISTDLLNISADIRQLALIIILTRAGLSFDLAELKKNGRSAIMLCFVPAVFEIFGYIVFGTRLLDMSWKNAAVMGCVMAAVSPAVIVPRMLKLKEEGYGTDKGIPQMIMAGASADDIFVIVLFTSLIALPSDKGFDWGILWKIPCSIVLGHRCRLAAEVFLFALVGAEVDIRFAIKAGVMILAVMGLAMVLRLLGVYLCVLGTKLNYKELLFCMIAYIPKATVQAAIGATPLSMGLSCGQMVLTAAVLSILAAAPIGALLIDCLYCRLLQKPE